MPASSVTVGPGGSRPRARRPHRGTIAAALALWLGSVALGFAADAPADSGGPSTEDDYRLGFALGTELGQRRDQGSAVHLESVLRGLLDALAAPSSGAGAGTEDAPATGRTGGFVDDFAALNALRPGVVTLPSGVQYEVLHTGDGRRPGSSDRVGIRYRGSLSDGSLFDRTDEDGTPLALALEEIAVPGLREALLLMQEGDRWRVVIPPSMGFARSGNNLLRKRDLIYEVELVSVEPAADPPAAKSGR